MIPLLTAHLWQSTFFAVAAGLLTLAFRGNRAQVRYWLWLSASIKFLLPFALLMSAGSALETWIPATRQIATPAVSYTLEQFTEPLLYRGSAAPLPSTGETIHWIPVALLVVWLGGCLTIAAIRLRNWLRIRAAVHAGTVTDIHAGVEVLISPGLLEPGVVGLLRPILLLPEGITERLTPSELKAVLAHELCHVRRRDNLLSAIHMVVETVFWFHPLVWWVGARLVAERERACDEEVLSQGNAADVYADAILNVCKLYVESPLTCVSGVSGASIRRRIEAIMSNRRLLRLSGAKKFLLAGAGAVALAGPVATGLVIGVGNAPLMRAQPAPQFDAVSIRRCMPGDELTGLGGRGGGGGRGPRPSPGRLTIQCMDVAAMISMAYAGTANDRPINFSVSDPTDKLFRGGPAWVYSDWYTIEAETDDAAANGPTSPGRTPADRMMEGPMLQAILEDRFQLKLHREAEEVPMFALTVAKGGLKIKPLDGGCITLDPTKEHHASDFSGPKPVCNTVLGGWNGPNRTWQVTGRLDSFAHNLSGILNRTVLNKTGIEAIFSLHLEYAPDENTPARRRPDGSLPPVPEPSDIPPGATIFTAVEEQLGMKLVPDKGTQGFFVIDRVARPSEN
jgi:bla regulator protein BlaR1